MVMRISIRVIYDIEWMVVDVEADGGLALQPYLSVVLLLALWRSGSASDGRLLLLLLPCIFECCSPSTKRRVSRRRNLILAAATC